MAKMIRSAARARSPRVGSRGTRARRFSRRQLIEITAGPPRSASATPDARDFVYRVSPLLVESGKTIDFEDAVRRETSARE